MRSKALVYGVAFSAAGIVLGAQAPPASQTPGPQTPQQPSVTFRAGVDYVEIDARVTDSRGQFVRGLNADDFVVVEDGSPQQVSVFSLVEVPREFDDRPLYRTTPIRADVYTNERPFVGRMYMLILDDLHVDVRRTGQVRRSARQFIERYMSANDMAAIIHVAQPAANQEFTSNKFLLTRSIEKFTGQKLKSPTLNKLDDFLSKVEDEELREKPAQDNDMGLRSNWAQTSMMLLQQMSQYVARTQGRRKAFLYFSEGIDYDLQSPMFESFSGIPMGTDASVINLAMREVFVTATRANVAIYPIDPRGLAIGIEEVVSMPNTMQPIVDPATGLPTGQNFGLDRVLDGLRFELDGSLDVLRTMANETGGVAAINTNDLDGPFRRIVDDSSNYYLLGYYPTNRSRNGAFRRVTVNVKTPGLDVRARRGYFAPRPNDGAKAKAEAEDPVTALLAAPVATTGLTMRAAAQAIKGPSETGAVHLVVEIPAGQVPFQEIEGHFGNELVITYEAVDSTGVRRAANRHTAKFTMKPYTYEQALTHGVSLTTQFSLPPGHYQLRIGALERLTGRTGSVYADLEVPAFISAPLAMSDLTLSTPRFAFGFSLVNDTERLPRVLPAPPTTRREFLAKEPLAAYVEIYANDRRQYTVDLEARLTTEDGREVFRAVDHKTTKELSGAAGGHGFLIWLPTKDLNPGRYVLTMQAQSRLTEGATIQRETVITIK
jgi:VWFA-related protein